MSSSVLLKGAVYDQKVVLKVLLDREAQRPSPKMTEKLIRAICSTWFHSPPEEMIKVIIWDTNSKACLPPSIPAQSLWPNLLCKRECNMRSMYYRTCWTPISHFLYRQYVDNIDDKKVFFDFCQICFEMTENVNYKYMAVWLHWEHGIDYCFNQTTAVRVDSPF